MSDIEEHRSGHDRRREPTRRDVDRRLLRVMVALAFVFLIVAVVTSIAALENTHDIDRNAKAIEHQRITQEYDGSLTKWRLDLDGCKQGTTIFLALLARQRADAVIFSQELVSRKARAYFNKQIADFDRQLSFFSPDLCDKRYPKPDPPPGVQAPYEGPH